MSQVDYTHFFSNIVWSSILLGVIYLLICWFYVQNFYKIFRLRNLTLNRIYLLSTSRFVIWSFLSDFLIKTYNHLKNYYTKFINDLLSKKKYTLKVLCT